MRRGGISSRGNGTCKCSDAGHAWCVLGSPRRTVWQKTFREKWMEGTGEVCRSQIICISMSHGRDFGYHYRHDRKLLEDFECGMMWSNLWLLIDWLTALLRYTKLTNFKWTVSWILTNIYSGVNIIYTEHFHTSKSFLVPVAVNPCSHPQVQATTDPLSMTIWLWFYIF